MATGGFAVVTSSLAGSGVLHPPRVAVVGGCSGEGMLMKSFVPLASSRQRLTAPAHPPNYPHSFVHFPPYMEKAGADGQGPWRLSVSCITVGSTGWYGDPRLLRLSEDWSSQGVVRQRPARGGSAPPPSLCKGFLVKDGIPRASPLGRLVSDLG